MGDDFTLSTMLDVSSCLANETPKRSATGRQGAREPGQATHAGDARRRVVRECRVWMYARQVEIFFSFSFLFYFILIYRCFSFYRVISNVNKRSFVVRLCLGVLDKDRDLSGCGYASVRSVAQKIKLPKDFLFYVPMGLLRFHLFATNVLAARGWLVLMLFTCVSCWIIADCVLFIF